MKRKLLLLTLPVITILLETLPAGVKMCFMGPNQQEYFTEYYSYFDTFPIGYAMFSPILTAVISCLILALLIIYCFVSNSSLLKAIKVLLCVAIGLSLCHLIFGFKYLTLVGGLVTLSMIVELILLYLIKD